MKWLRGLPAKIEAKSSVQKKQLDHFFGWVKLADFKKGEVPKLGKEWSDPDKRAPSCVSNKCDWAYPDDLGDPWYVITDSSNPANIGKFMHSKTGEIKEAPAGYHLLMGIKAEMERETKPVSNWDWFVKGFYNW